MAWDGLNSGQMVLSFTAVAEGALDEASRFMISTYGLDFTLNVLYGPIDNSMSKWITISEGVPPSLE